VSTSGQILDGQPRALTGADCIRVFADKLSGKIADRPERTARLDYLRQASARSRTCRRPTANRQPRRCRRSGGQHSRPLEVGGAVPQTAAICSLACENVAGC